MSKEELINALDELGVNRNEYSLDGRLVEGLMLDRTTNHYGVDKQYYEWRVFYNNRGIRHDEKAYYSESEAYENILQQCIKLYKRS